MPNHRPPWIQLYQASLKLPGSLASFRLLMKSHWFLRSGMGFGGCFCDLDAESSAALDPALPGVAQAAGIARELQAADEVALVPALGDGLRRLLLQSRCRIIGRPGSSFTRRRSSCRDRSRASGC